MTIVSAIFGTGKLQAAMIAREALAILDGILERPRLHFERYRFPLACTSPNPNAYGRPMYSVGGWVSERDFALTLDNFRDTIIEPLMNELAGKLPIGAVVSGKSLDLPWGTSAARETYNGRLIRCVIDEKCPIGDALVPEARMLRHYDVGSNELRNGMVGIALRFDVTTDPYRIELDDGA